MAKMGYYGLSMDYDVKKKSCYNRKFGVIDVRNTCDAHARVIRYTYYYSVSYYI